MKTLRIGLILTFFISFMLLMGCAPGTGKFTAAQPAGFFSGVWHGWIAPFCVIIGLFDPDVRIYEPFNTGWWYDFGFYVAVISGFGGLSLTRKNKHG